MGALALFPPIALAQQEVVCDSEVVAQETQYLAALGMVATYQLQGDTLELRTAEGALAVTFADRADN